MALNCDPVFPHVCPDDGVERPDQMCSICRWLWWREVRDQFYRERVRNEQALQRKYQRKCLQ